MATQYHNPSLPTNLYSSGAVKFDNRQLNQMLYAEQKQREAQRAAEAKALQEEFANNVSKMRDADVADYTNLYSKYKEQKKALLFDKKLQKDPLAFQQAQMQTARTYADLNKLSNASRQDREDTELMRKDWLIHGENYVDDFATMLSARNKLPLSQLSQVDLGEVDEKGQRKYRDLSNWDAFRYKGVDYDPTKLLNTAQGTEMKREFDEGAVDKTGLQNKITTYQFHGSSPMQYRDTILGGMLGDRKANKFFQYQLKNTTPEEIERVNKEFANIPDSVWKQWGVNKQELTQSTPDNKSETVANYLAKKYAIDNLPKAIKTDLRTNERVKMDMQNAAAMERLRKGHEYRLNEIAAKATHTGKEVQSVVNKEIGDLLEYAKSNPVPYVDTDNGPHKTGYDLPLTESVITAAQQEKGEPINAVRYVKKDGKDMIYVVKYKPTLSADGRTIVGYEKNNKGKPIIDTQQSRYMPLNVFKNQYAKDMFKGKILQGEMGEDVNIEDIDMDGGGVVPSTPQRSTKPTKAVKVQRGKYD